jgi:ATP-dependent Lon protease
MIVPLFVGREKSVRALEEVMKEEKQILLLTQKSAGDDDPSADGLYRIGQTISRRLSDPLRKRRAPSRKPRHLFAPLRPISRII